MKSVNLEKLYKETAKTKKDYKSAIALVKENHRKVNGIPVSLMLLILGLHNTQIPFDTIAGIDKDGNYLTGIDYFIDKNSDAVNVKKELPENESYSELNITKGFEHDGNYYQVQLILDFQLNLEKINIYISETVIIY